MLIHYLKIFLKFFSVNRTYILINYIGFTLGLLCWIFLSLWMDYEFKAKEIHDKSLRLVKVGVNFKENTEIKYRTGMATIKRLFPDSPITLKEEILDGIEEIKHSSRFGYLENKNVLANGTKYEEFRFAYADTNIFKIMRFKFLQGSYKTAFKESNSVIVTENTVKKYFPNSSNLIGNKVKLDDGKEFTISAVIENIPDYYKFQFEFLTDISVIHSDEFYKHNNRVVTYALIEKAESIEEVENKINKIINPNAKNNIIRVGKISHPYQYEPLVAYSEATKPAPLLYIFTISITFILLTAAFNYSNISTVFASKRAVEVGIRKVSGANKTQIMFQYLTESVFTAIICLLIAVGLTYILLPVFNGITGFDLSFNYSITFILELFLVALITGLIAGIYPAIFMSSFKPINILKGDLRSGPRGEIFRKIIVVLQFSLSITFIVASFIVYEQYELIETKKLTYNNEYVLNLELNQNSAKYVDISKLQDYERILKIIETQNSSYEITINSIDMKKTYEYIESEVNNISGISDYRLSFLDKDFDKIYQINEMKSNLLYFFTMVIIFVTYIGLFGHSAFMVKQKNSEISLRKTFGAEFKNIYGMISKEYIKLVLISNLIGFFIVVWVMNAWFIRFSHRISINYDNFLYTLIITLSLTLLTVLYLTLIVNREKPIKYLLRE